jgi:hypothetical protein
MRHSFNGDVRTMALNGTTLFVGGNFSSVNGSTRGYIAALDTSSGALLGWNPAVGSSGSGVYKILVNGTSMFVGGAHTVLGTTGSAYLSVVDIPGASVVPWATSVTGGASLLVADMAIDSNTLYVIAWFYLGHGNCANVLSGN